MQEEISPQANFFPGRVRDAITEAPRAGAPSASYGIARCAGKADEMGISCANERTVDSGAKQSYTAEPCHMC